MKTYKDVVNEEEETSKEFLVDMLKECRDELCLQCGRYKESHNGACEGCIWQA